MRPEGEPIHVLVVGAGVDDLPGAVIETADDLLGALARVADGGIDVVLLSLDLPDGQGADAVRVIRERAPEIPVIAVDAGGGAQRAIEAGASDVVPSDGGVDLLARAVRYAVALDRMRTELHRREVVDELTGLSNARGFERFAQHHLAMARRSRRPVVLLFVRLEGFEELDETEDAEERVRRLSATADVLSTAVRDSDVVAHIGAGAFCLLLTGDAVGAESLVLSRVVDAVAANNARRGDAALTLSVGAAAFDPDRPLSLDELIARAGGRAREASA
ncbi:MAG: GGDEF domain-containing protein [Actinomycetota bacterium]